MRRFLMVSMAIFVLAGAAQASAPTTALTAQDSGAYRLDTEHASIIFTVRHLGFSNYTGRFNQFDATLTLDAVNLEKSRVKVTVNPGSVDVHDSSLEATLADTEFFDTGKFPEAVFVSTRVEKTSATTLDIHGDLTLRGVTRPLVLKAVFNGVGNDPFLRKRKLGFSATTSMRRSDFGMKAYLPDVGDEVNLTIEAEFIKAD
jgi:polyisoprenoid-binding protein YceI